MVPIVFGLIQEYGLYDILFFLKMIKTWSLNNVFLLLLLQGIESALDKAVTAEGQIKNHEYAIQESWSYIFWFLCNHLGEL